MSGFEKEFINPKDLPPMIEGELKKAPASQLDILYLRQSNFELRTEFNNMLAKQGIVNIKNGGGRMRPFERKDFEQWIYDRLTWKGFWVKIIAVAGLALTILQIISLIILIGGKK